MHKDVSPDAWQGQFIWRNRYLNRYPLVAVFLLLVVDVTGTETRTGKRPVTVADSIEMVQIADRSYRDDFLAKGDDVAHFSPNGSRFAVVTRKGNLAQNMVEFSIIVFATADVLHKPKPETILTLASSSNRDAISKLTWLSDNDSIVFLGERPGEQPQVYRVSSRTRSLEKLTNHPTELTSFVITPTGDRLIYVARAEKAPGITESMRQHGFTLTTENLQGLIREECDKTSGPYDDEVPLPNQTFQRP